MSTAKFARTKPLRGRNAQRRRSKPGDRGPAASEQQTYIYGHHSVAAALANPRRKILHAFATPQMADRFASAFAARGLTPTVDDARGLARLLEPEAVHQGVIVEVLPLAQPKLAEIVPAGPIVILDQVTDPRNVGAILRVSAAFSAAALVTTRRHAPAQGSLIAKAASGGLEHVPVIEVANLARTLSNLRDHGYWIAGLDSVGDTPFETVAGEQRLAIVLGSEGQGLRRLTRESCDHLYKLALPGPISSLNVSTAAALALYAISRSRA